MKRLLLYVFHLLVSVIALAAASDAYSIGEKHRTIHRVAPVPMTIPGAATESPNLITSITDYCGDIVYEDSILSRINFAGGYLSYVDYSGSRISTPEYHFYISDHLGNNRMDVTDMGGVWQAMDYYPYGLPMGSSYLPDKQRWLFGGKELDRVSGLDLYDFAARPYDPATGRFCSPDPFSEKYYPLSSYLYCAGNPLVNIDPTGCKTILYATNLPSSYSILNMATHTFIAVTNADGTLRGYFAYGPSDNGELKLMKYTQDKNIISGIDKEHLKAKIEVPVPDGMTQNEFDEKVIEVANSFGNNPQIDYCITAVGKTNGNCNSSTSTILLKSGVGEDVVAEISRQIPGISWGFNTTPKPWTSNEQKEAVNVVEALKSDEFVKQMVKGRELLTR